MAAPTSHSVTRLLLSWRQGNPAALEQLIPLVYQKLRRLARRYMAGQKPGHTLQATGLVNEAYVRLIDCQQVNWKDRAFLCRFGTGDAKSSGRVCALRPLPEKRRRSCEDISR